MLEQSSWWPCHFQTEGLIPVSWGQSPEDLEGQHPGATTSSTSLSGRPGTGLAGLEVIGWH